MAEFIKLNDSPASTRDAVVTLSGTRSNGVSSITVNGLAATLEPGLWRVSVLVTAGTNTFQIVGVHAGGNLYLTKVIEGLVETPVLEKAWNVFDEYGLLLGLPRLLGESNRSYALRLIDEGEFRSGPAITNVSIATARALGLQWTRDAFTLSVNRNVENQPLATNCLASISSSHLKISANELVHQFDAKVESSDGTVYLPAAYPPLAENQFSISYLNGDLVPSESFSLDDVEGTFILRFEDQSTRGRIVRISYPYELQFRLDRYTFRELKEAIQAVLDGSSTSLFQVSYTVPDSFEARKLCQAPITNINDEDSLTSHYVPMICKELIDDTFRRLWYTSDGHAYGTMLEAWAERALVITKSGWDNVILDSTSWQNENYCGGLPNLFDAVHTYWKSSPNSESIFADQAAFQGFKTYNGKPLLRIGVPNKNWKSGICSEKDLVPIDIVAVLES